MDGWIKTERERESYVFQPVVFVVSIRTLQKPSPRDVYKNSINNHVQLLVVSSGKSHTRITFVQEPPVTSNVMAHAQQRFESSRRIRGIKANIHCGDYHY